MGRNCSVASAWTMSIAGFALFLLCTCAFALDSSGQQRPLVTIPFTYNQMTQPFLLVQVSVNKS
ncbi:MAG: hypothetical protein C4335_06945 [Armatimonadota bacterium]